VKRKLTAERDAELVDELRLRVLFTNKMLCRRYGISPSTLKRKQRAALERPLPAIDADTMHVVCFPARRKVETI
jgi:hypothetical protein